VKHGDGGLVELEFCIHLRQLSECSGLDPHLGLSLRQLNFSPEFTEAYRLLTRLLIVLRVVAPHLHTPNEHVQALIAQLCKIPNWSELLAALKSARQRIHAEWIGIGAQLTKNHAATN